MRDCDTSQYQSGPLTPNSELIALGEFVAPSALLITQTNQTINPTVWEVMKQRCWLAWVVGYEFLVTLGQDRGAQKPLDHFRVDRTR